MGQDFPLIYRMSRSGRNFHVIVGLLAIALGLACAIGMGVSALAVLFLLFCLALGAPLIAVAHRTRVVVTEDAIEVRELFRQKSMRRADIAGFRIVQGDGARLRLESGRAGMPALTLPAFIAWDSRIDDWLAGAVNHDQQERQASLDAVLANPELPGSTQERLDALQRARRVARIATLASLVITLWAFFYPHPYDLTLALAALCPWIVLGIAMSSPALYRLNAMRNDMGADLSAAIMMPVAPLVMRGMFIAEVVDGWRLFFLILGACVLLTALLCWWVRELRTIGAALSFGLFMGGYAYGVAGVANVRADRSEPAAFEVTVLGQNAVTGNPPEYHLNVGPWGPRTEAADVNVGGEFYATVSTGEMVCVYLWPGALGVRWYWVGRCRQ